MILPDCRRDESYNQDFLNERDKEFLAGFDWATEMACDNFFDNRYDDTNSDENSDYLDRTLTKEVPDYMQEEYIMEHSFENMQDEKRKVKTYADYVRFEILKWIEEQRNELITSMIDGMNEDEYKTLREKALKEHPNKKYCDTRSYSYLMAETENQEE